MQAHDTVPIIQQAIQLSIAPVFLLTGIAALLGVMANRLARIIDRARDLDRRRKELDQANAGKARQEIMELERRRRYASWAINFCTCAALLVCLVIVTLFVEEFVQTDLTWLAGAQFVAAMISLIGGLSCFLAEVYIATHSSRIESESFAR
jgi:Zn-dependent protease